MGSDTERKLGKVNEHLSLPSSFVTLYFAVPALLSGFASAYLWITKSPFYGGVVILAGTLLALAGLLIYQQQRLRRFELHRNTDHIYEMLRMEKLRRNDTAKLLNVTEFTEHAKDLRSREVHSEHVLYATKDSIEEFYLGEVFKNDWLESEREDSKDKRRRILVVEHASKNECRASLAKIFCQVDRTSHVKVIEDTTLLKNGFGYLVRDFGIFHARTKDGGVEKQVLFPYTPVKPRRAFSLFPGELYHISNHEYIDQLSQQFDAVWNDKALNAEHFPTGIAALLQKDAQKIPASEIPRIIHWEAFAERKLTQQNFSHLLENRFPAIRIPDFATEEECEAYVRAVETVYHNKTEYYRNVSPPIGKAGATQFEAGEDKKRYFTNAEKARAEQQEIIRLARFNPLQRMLDHLNTIGGLSVKIARESEYGKYFAGIMRFTVHGTLLHVDYAHHDAPGFHIGGVYQQIAWNLFLEAPEREGNCLVYEKEWNECDEMCRTYGSSYGYNEKLVEGVRHFTIPPRRGDVVLFNCRNYHKVEPPVGQRTTIGAFVGRHEDGTLLDPLRSCIFKFFMPVVL